jgi:antitoxin (DNA-binding transcriptional repressor) of toxin-antitoxin stability system
MSAISIDIHETNISIKDLIGLLYLHEEIIITDKNEPIAKATSLIPRIAQNVSDQQPRQIGLTKGEAWISPDFDEPLEDFAEYMP